VERCGGIDGVFRASLTELEASGIQATSAQSLHSGRSLGLAEEEMVRAIAAGAQVIGLDDPEYPPLLRQIYDPPVTLHVRGEAGALSHPGVAVVGTRHPTPYGLGMAERLSCDLAAHGIIIISGMARGVDTSAHRGAFNAHGKTVAVFGTGIDVIYPRENQKIADQILADSGALVSEFPVGSFAAPQELPCDVRLTLAPAAEAATGAPAAASLFETELQPHEKKVFALLKADESTHIDQLVESLEGEVSSSEIFAALFELEMASKIRQLPGKNYVRTF